MQDRMMHYFQVFIPDWQEWKHVYGHGHLMAGQVMERDKISLVVGGGGGWLSAFLDGDTKNRENRENQRIQEFKESKVLLLF